MLQERDVRGDVTATEVAVRTAQDASPRTAEPKEWEVKRAKRLEKYKKSGKFVGGNFFSKGGTATLVTGETLTFQPEMITPARIAKYEPMCHYMVRKFLPAMALWEASYSYDDLVNQCRNEVFLALLDKWDPVEAMGSTIQDQEKRKAQLLKKAKNPTKALETAEKGIVYVRLQNYLRRTRYKYHPDQVGGRTGSMDALVEGINQEFHNRLFTDRRVVPQEEKDIQLLLRVQRMKGDGAVKEAYMRLGGDRRSGVVELLTPEQNAWAFFEAEETEDELRKERVDREKDLEARRAVVASAAIVVLDATPVVLNGQSFVLERRQCVTCPAEYRVLRGNPQKTCSKECAGFPVKTEMTEHPAETAEPEEV